MNPIDRRSFLKGGLALPAAAALPSLFSWAAAAAAPNGRILVLLRLDGGNDGLNTVVPFADDAYHRARPGIGISAKSALHLDDYEGLHPSLAGLHRLWGKGDLAIVQGVGYPHPSRSHFTSTDIWNTASVQPPARWNGWLGRALDRAAPRGVPGLQLDSGPLNPALVGEQVVVPSVADAARFKVHGPRELLAAVARRPRANATLEYVRKSAEQAYATSARIERALDRGTVARDRYPATALALRFWQVARVIEAGLPARVYAVRLSGFDTHSRQASAHAQLLRILGEALEAFQTDLAARGLDKRVLTMTYSEFGRRTKENSSLGTDHGKAAPMFLVGGGLKPGLHGKHPSLEDLDEGDLRFHTDFRRVYATVLDRWLEVDSRAVLGSAFQPLAFL